MRISNSFAQPPAATTAIPSHAESLCASRSEPLGLKRLLAIGFMSLALAACGGNGTGAHDDAGAPSAPAGDPNDTPGDPTALACVQEGYPCSFDAVELSVIERSLALSSDAAKQLRDGVAIEEVSAMLSAQSDIAEVTVDGQVLGFRLVGGRPMIVDVTGQQEWLDGGPAQDPAASEANASFNSEVSNAASLASYAQVATKPRTVRTTISPKLVGGGNKAQRRALVLSPFRYEANFGDAGELIAGAIDNVRGYTGNVTYLATDDSANPEVTIDILTQLADYDVIHIDTHGGTLCKRKADVSTGATACELSVTDFLVQRFHGTAEDLKSIKHPGVVHYVGRVHESLAVTPDFFRHYYPSGLADKLFILASCNTFQADMGNAIAGNSGVFVSWDGFTDYSLVTSYGLALLESLRQGLTIGESFARLPSFTPDNPEANGMLQRTQRKAGGDLRIRDLITVRDNITGNLVTDLSGIEVMEAPEDGINDNLDLELIIDGVTQEQLANFHVNVNVEGHHLGYIDLQQSGIPADDFSYSVSTRVPLPFDVAEGQSLRLDFWIPLPDQGEDHFIATPKVNERELGREWTLNSTLTHDTTTITASVTFERDPNDDPSGNFHYFYVKSGTVHYQRSFEGADDCIYHIDEVVQLAAGAPDNWIAFGTNAGQPVVTGFGRIPSQSIEVTSCGNPLTVNIGSTYFLNQETVVVGDTVQGVYNNGAQIPTIVEWTLHKDL